MSLLPTTVVLLVLRTIVLIVLFIPLSFIGGAAVLSRIYDQTMRNAHTDLPLTNEFATLFPQADEAITHFPFSDPSWRSEALVYGRYCISMNFPIRRLMPGIHSAPDGPPNFVVSEVTSIERWPDGRIYSTYGNAHVFGLQEWNVLVKSKGDLSSLGFTVVKDKPHAEMAVLQC